MSKRSRSSRYSRRRAKERRDYKDELQNQELMDDYEQEAEEPTYQPEPLKRIERLEDPFADKTQDADDHKAVENWVAEDKRKWYVLDTNLILACVDVLYDATDESWRPPLDFRPNLDNAHLIIPDTVFGELNRIKDGHTVNRSIARKAFERLEKFFPNSERTLREIMMLRQPIRTGWKNQVISILPLHRDFYKSLPWIPKPDDNDGWIAVTALAATMIRDGVAVNGTTTVDEVLARSNVRRDVVLLTNDRPLKSAADHYAVRARGYSFTERPAFTGVRQLTVPAEMFAQFYHTGRITKEEFERYMPDEAALVANEYIVMRPRDDRYPQSWSDYMSDVQYANIARYSKSKQLLLPMRCMEREGKLAPNAGIATYYDAMNDEENIHVIVVTGDPGTGKTYQIVYHSIKALHDGRYAKAILIVNSNNGVGYLPGSQEKKLDPMVQFCKDAIRSYLARTPEFREKREILRKFGDVPESELKKDYTNGNSTQGKHKNKRKRRRKRIEYDADGYETMDYAYIEEPSEEVGGKRAANNGHSTDAAKSQKTYHELLDERVNYIYDRYFTAIPYEQARGRTFEDAIIIIDEAQRIIIDDMDTFITRLGRGSLLVVCGDVNQIRYNSPEKRIKNGLIFTRRVYYDMEGCANIHLVDSMRHEMIAIANQNYMSIIEKLGELET